MNYSIKEDFWLFANDLAEYHASREGQAVFKAARYNDLDEVIPSHELSAALDAYFNARNGAGLTFDDPKAREEGRAFDEYVARVYSELN